MEPDMFMGVFINWILGIVSLICVVGILVFPIITIIMLIVEGSKKVPAGSKRSFKKSIAFGILFVISIAVLILALIFWGLVAYFLTNGNVY